MKALIVLFALVLIVVGCLYYCTGLSSFDPQQQIDDLKRNVKVGMAWEQVVAVREPRKYQAFNSDPSSHTGRHQEIKFDRDVVANTVSSGGYKDGFVFPYHFSGSHAIEVEFDAEGKVTGFNKPVTTGDLLQGNLRPN